MILESGGPGGATVEVSVRAAEAELHLLALQLRRVPVNDAALEFHRGALALKRDLGRWRTQRPEPETIRAALDRIAQMRREVAERWPLQRRSSDGSPRNTARPK